jgi:hypothetical protein
LNYGEAQLLLNYIRRQADQLLPLCGTITSALAEQLPLNYFRFAEQLPLNYARSANYN